MADIRDKGSLYSSGSRSVLRIQISKIVLIANINSCMCSGSKYEYIERDKHQQSVCRAGC